MKHKQLLFILAILLVGCHSREVGFVYKPVNPRAGQVITFTNSSEVGSTWSWNFGDGTSSTVKSPTKTYTSAGDYLVTLVVDDKKSLTYSAVVVVSDTVPTIVTSDSATTIYNKVKCSVRCYNPKKEKITYKWLLSDDVIIVDGLLTDSAVNVYFTRPADKADIGAVITLGEQVDTVFSHIHVKDTAAHALVINSTDNQLFRHRIFAPQLGDKHLLDGGIIANHLEVYGDDVYAFADAGVYRISQAGSSKIVDYDKPIIAGTILHDTLFFKAADDVLYGFDMAMIDNQGALIPSVTDIATGRGGNEQDVIAATYMSADGDNLLLAGNGIAIAGQTYEGISNVSVAVVDKINGKIYAVDAVLGQLFVFNYGKESTQAVAIAQADGNSLALDYRYDRIYFTLDNELYALPLIHSRQNTDANQPIKFGAGVHSFTIDTKLRNIN